MAWWMQSGAECLVETRLSVAIAAVQLVIYGVNPPGYQQISLQ